MPGGACGLEHSGGGRHHRCGSGDDTVWNAGASTQRQWSGVYRVCDPGLVKSKKREDIYITPGSPRENAYIESFHDKLRDECLNREVFGSLWEARVVIEQWCLYYNAERPHSSLGCQTPVEFAGRVFGGSGLRSGFAILPTRTTGLNIKPMAELYL